MKLKFNQKYEVFREGTKVPGTPWEFGGEWLGTIEMEDKTFSTSRGFYGGYTRLTSEQLIEIANKIDELSRKNKQ